MPNIPSVGLFIPNGYLNVGSFASPSGQGDAYGNIYPSGTTPGKMIQLSPSEAQGLAAPGTQLYDGTYQIVLLDSGATSSLAANGLSAWIRLDSGPTQGALPMTDYENGTVTTPDQIQVVAPGGTYLFAGIFINPATVKGVNTLPTPGQYCFIFTGGGRANVVYNGSATAGNNVLPVAPSSAQTGQFAPGAAAASVFPNGIALQATSGAASVGLVAFQDIIYRVSNQGV
jgi:hypothetical protein